MVRSPIPMPRQAVFPTVLFGCGSLVAGGRSRLSATELCVQGTPLFSLPGGPAFSPSALLLCKVSVQQYLALESVDQMFAGDALVVEHLPWVQSPALGKGVGSQGRGCWGGRVGRFWQIGLAGNGKSSQPTYYVRSVF